MQSQPTTLLCRYGYDPLDRLTSHTLSQTPERLRFYCKSRLTTEIQGAIKHSIVQHDDLLLAQQHVEGKAFDTTLLITDQQRSVLQTLKPDHPPQPLAYSPYGHLPAENGLLSLLGFNGERPDPMTGHYLLGNGYRAFNPALMRFNSPDSLSPFGKGGLNAYTYCLGDPINLEDPTGHSVLMRWPEIIHRVIKQNKLSRLDEAYDHVNNLFKKSITQSFKKHYDTTMQSYNRSTKLEALALAEFQELPHKAKHASNVPPKLRTLEPAPVSAKIKDNLDHLNSILIRDERGNITGVDKPFLRDYEYQHKVHNPTREPATKLLVNLNAEMIRAGR
ncbi:RHS repeat-associated core domain-containing protein [Pseudomonas fluorescens]|uniref:RHS repeat-associated core domain-containing protein n=1 Tax=Pseudomonas fluorescens TaxID=294 RepID=UPI001241F4EE|nr:RHS repeat-associated core domain-containing protein [Pseudomonas fluorescens]VVM71564.1 hypothetical protein PS639_01802 [Pseudomonas fluorescens]